MYPNLCMLSWILLIVLFLFLAVCAGILKFQAGQVGKRKDILLEALWARRNRISLLLETAARNGVNIDRARIIDLRAKTALGAYTLPEQIALEKQLTHLIAALFQKTEDEPSLKTDGLYLALKKEMEGNLSAIRIALNNYNFDLQLFKKYCGQPWFKILEFAFEIRNFAPLDPFE